MATATFPDQDRRWKLSGRLLKRLLPAVGLLWLLSAAAVLLIAHVEGRKAVDRSLARAAKLFLAYAEHEFAEKDIDDKDNDLQEIIRSENLRASGYEMQMWSHEGRLLVKSSGAPVQHLASVESGFQDVRLQGSGWRVFVIDDQDGRVRLEVAEHDSGRDAAVRSLMLTLLLPVLLGVPVLSAIVWLGLRHALASVSEAASEIASRAPVELGPVAGNRMPDEITPLVEAFNQLLGRVQQAVESERRFTADAAHELRTPLAAIRLQAQLAQRAGSPERATQALERLIAGVDRATRLTNQLLTLARYDHDDALALAGERAGLGSVIEGVVQELSPQAEPRGVRLAFVLCNEMPEVPAQAVHVLLRNLVENAIRHSPAGGTVRIAAGNSAEGWSLAVEDQGPGIPPEQRERIFDRFVSLQRGEGSGLGLSIVRRIAELLGARLDVGSGDGAGTRISVQAPPRA